MVAIQELRGARPAHSLTLLEQLDPVPEWVEYIETVESLEGCVHDWYEPRGPAARGEFWQTVDQDGRVRLAGSSEVWVHAEMKA